MKILETNIPDKILIDCQNCGGMFPVDDFRSEEYADVVRNCFEKHRLCDACRDLEELQKSQEASGQEKVQRAAKLPQLINSAGLEPLYCRDRQTGKLFTEPPCRFAAEWIYLHRFENLLLSGITGSGKSTSASFVAVKMLQEGKKVHYSSLRKLLSLWRAAKTSDHEFAAEKMLSEIFHFDLYIIDEVVGKARISESGQELLFEILESVNSGSCKARIWLLGNFYSGSIEDVFSDPAPVRRRLQENFSCVYLDKKNQKVTPVSVYQEQ